MRSYELNLDLGFKRFKKKIRERNGVFGEVSRSMSICCVILSMIRMEFIKKKNTLYIKLLNEISRK